MATVRKDGYQDVIIRALEKYRETLEMTVDTCSMVGDKDGERKALKEWTKAGLTLKQLARKNRGITED